MLDATINTRRQCTQGRAERVAATSMAVRRGTRVGMNIDEIHVSLVVATGDEHTRPPIKLHLVVLEE
jgi:hypothetical protein